MSNIIIGSARVDERGKYSGGKAGDQTGGEISTQKFYVHTKGWYVLRAKDENVADKLAMAMQQACDNNKCGYDQSQRITGFDALKKCGSMEKINYNVEWDCSSLVRGCIYQATGKDVGNFTTINEPDLLSKCGMFNIYSYTSGTKLYKGDILVTKTKGHTVIVVSGETRVETNTSISNYYDKYTGSSIMVDVVLRAINVPTQYIGSVSKRKPIATANGIPGYKGYANQNLAIIELAKKGKLKRV